MISTVTFASAAPGSSADVATAEVYLLRGYEACVAKDFDGCATEAKRALEVDPSNEYALKLFKIADAQDGKPAELPKGRTSPGFQSRMHRLGAETMLFLGGSGAPMHLSGLRYNYQVGRSVLWRFGAAVSVGQLRQERESSLYLAVAAEPTLAAGGEWRIGKVGAFAILGEFQAGFLHVKDERYTYIIRPRGVAEFSYGRLSLFSGFGFMRHGLYPTMEKAKLELGFTLGLSIAL